MSPRTELIRSLAALVEEPAPQHERIARLLGLAGPPDPEAHTELFQHQVYPFASVYLGPEGMLGGDARGRIAGFWTAVGHEPPEDCDHLAALLALWSGLLDRGEAEGDPARLALLVEAAEALVAEHLVPWVFVFIEAIRGLGTVEGGPDSFFSDWADQLGRVVAEAVPRGTGRLPVHLAVAPELDDPSALGGEAFLDALLAPVRSGMVLARANLSRMSATMGLGTRIGERKYTLRACISQDAPGVFTWLASEARGWTRRHSNPDPTVEAFWKGRASHTADVLERAALEAKTWIVT